MKRLIISKKLIAVVALVTAVILTLGACGNAAPESEEESTPPPIEQLAVKNAAEAREAVIAYLQTVGDVVPETGMTWQETDATTPGLVGSTKTQYTTEDWTVGVAYPVVRPDLTEYHIIISSIKHGLHWEGKVKTDGTVSEISSLMEMTETASQQLAEDFIKNSPTFVFDGMADTLELVETLRARCPYCWVFVYEFDSSQAGYGDRTGQMLAQVITHHRALVAVEQMKVASAAMDDSWDMLLQEELETFEPTVEGSLIEISCDAFMENNNITRQVELNAGDTLKVVLCSNPTTGFQWSEEAQIGNQDIVKQVEHSFTSPESESPVIAGAAGQETWVFEALAEGTATISMEYSRPWEGGEKAEWTFELMVTVK